MAHEPSHYILKIISLIEGRVITSTKEAKCQVTGIQFSNDGKWLVSTQGSPSNSVILWKFSDRLTKLTEFTEHTGRITGCTLVEKGRVLVTYSADETLRFWNIFSNNAAQTTRARKPGEDWDLENIPVIR